MALATRDIKKIKSYDEFTQKLIKRFDRIDAEWYFKRLTQLRQEGSVMEFSREFEKLSAMVSKISKKRLTYLFIDGLKESIKSAVGAHEPKRLEDAIQKVLKFDTHQINDRSKNHAPSTHSKHYEKGRNHCKD